MTSCVADYHIVIVSTTGKSRFVREFSEMDEKYDVVVLGTGLKVR